MIKSKFFNFRFITQTFAFVLALCFIESFFVSSTHAMAPHQVYSENHSEEEPLEHSSPTTHEATLHTESHALVAEFVTLVSEHHMLKQRKPTDLWKEVTSSKIYKTGKFVTHATSYFLTHFYILTPCMGALFKQSLRGYDTLVGCNLPTTTQDEESMAWVCDDQTRYWVALTALLPVGYCLNKKLSNAAVKISDSVDYCSKKLIKAYESYRDQSVQERTQEVEKLILRISHELAARSEELRTWPTRERKLIFHAASMVGQLELMNAVLRPEKPREVKVFERIQRIIEERCTICLEDIEQKKSPLDTTVERRCDHVFHESCILNWYKTLLKSHSPLVCPICRSTEIDPQTGEGSHLLHKQWSLSDEQGD